MSDPFIPRHFMRGKSRFLFFSMVFLLLLSLGYRSNLGHIGAIIQYPYTLYISIIFTVCWIGLYFSFGFWNDDPTVKVLFFILAGLRLVIAIIDFTNERWLSQELHHLLFKLPMGYSLNPAHNITLNIAWMVFALILGVKAHMNAPIRMSSLLVLLSVLNLQFILPAIDKQIWAVWTYSNNAMASNLSNALYVGSLVFQTMSMIFFFASMSFTKRRII